jgi:hypothetical protein
MKIVKYSALLAFVTLSLSVGVFAKDENEGRFTVSDSVQIGSNQLTAGEYKASWEGSGPDVQVKILRGKNVVASAPAKLVDEPSGQNSITRAASSRLVQEIHFGSLHKSLVFSLAVAAQN